MSKKRLLKLKKISGVTSTQPLYETLDGEEFTVSDIVQGKVKPPKAYRGKSYRLAWWLSFLGLWSRGMIFVGPLLILIGMALTTLTKEQFSGDVH